MHRVVLATRNAGKVAELRRILAVYDIELVGLESFADIGDIAETGATFAENALIKAHEVSRSTGLVAVADDSGLAVAALNGMPGVLSARWAGRHGDDLANLELVLSQLVDVPEDRRGAAFVCAAAAATPDGREVVVTEQLDGTLRREPRGSNGFGYDPIFVPIGETRTTAEMSPERKDEISHRGKAFRALAPRLTEMLD
ncbi:MAG TPA: RdgB/HAM1 family non-canonical purine NTP pyrophosphatase [Mycobacteriales bacterium]|jgi:XTP/dITP diphosphohydrolase|nr:RdgB/HAM1 family non-canonical purine NTP pyrophosphatase [Mycobacteriales bacterium]